MKVQCRLLRLLQENNLYYHGTVVEMAAALDVTRQTVTRLLRGDNPSISFEMLGKVSKWLIEKGIPAETLPQALIGPDAIWDHIRAARRIAIWLGEYEVEDPRRFSRTMVARRDVQVATGIIRELAHYRLLMARELTIDYLPFQYKDKSHTDVRDEDHHNAATNFAKMRRFQDSKTEPTIVFYVGSQKCNLLVEHMVASHFNCKPFQAPADQNRPPIFLLYREGDPPLTSCFGGTTRPGAAGRSTKERSGPAARSVAAREPGIYYLDGDEWICCPYKEGTSDAAVVIISEHPQASSFEIGLFGFSSVSTSAVGTYFLSHSEEFWPPSADMSNGRRLGIFVCRFRYVDGEDPRCEVIQVAERVLKNAGGSKRRANAPQGG